jgi:hypothetical protein
MALVHDRGMAMRDKHRAWLERSELIGVGTCIWCGLNPSTASADRNDPTITREIGFTRRHGFKQMVKVNLLTGRATHPENLWALDDPVEPEADAALERALRLAANSQNLFICAWGARPASPYGLRELYDLRVRHVLARAYALDVDLWCLGLAESGAPRHPLYVAGNAPLVPFEGGGAI